MRCRNRLGIRLSWVRTAPEEVEATLALGTDHQGYPGLVHGGILAALIDEALGTAMLALHPDRLMVTSTLEIEYVQPVLVGQEIRVRARVTSDLRHLADLAADVRFPGGEIAVRARARLARPIRSSRAYQVVRG